jgi:hypothetical protein
LGISLGIMVREILYNYVIVVQKALQVTNGLKFIEIIEMVKKTVKNLKQTNYGKKIYDNLMKNYGEYLNLPNNNIKPVKKVATLKKSTITQKKDKCNSSTNI